MLYMVKLLVRYHVKSLVYRFQTWLNKKEIEHAYRTKEYRIPRLFTRRNLSFVCGGIVIVGLVLALAVSLPALDMSFLAGLRPHYPQRSNTRVSSGPRFPVSLSSTSEELESTLPDTQIVDAALPKDTLSSRYPPHLYYPGFLRYAICANKADQTMYLFQRDSISAWHLHRTFFMATGERRGRKERDGDRKTPEGLYFIIGRKEGMELESMYGPLAYILNYPNKEDRAQGRNGNGIWIHGTARDSIPFQTKGCLELYNTNLRELSTFLGIGIGVPVVIVNTPDSVDTAMFTLYGDYLDRRDELLTSYLSSQRVLSDVVTSWKQAWESKNIFAYRKYYDTLAFSGGGLSWDTWRRRKLATFDMYDWITISVTRFFLAEVTKQKAVVKFLQEYNTDKSHFENGKVLVLRKNDGEWKIHRESTFPQQEHIL